MEEQRHIINKQTLEIHLPKTADVFGVQQKLSNLYREQWVSIIDKILCDRYGGVENKQLQIDQLTIDLGVVQMENITTVFAEKFMEVLAEVQVSDDATALQAEEKMTKSQKTPLRLLSHYLSTGVLPWWSEDTTKAFLQDQLELLIQTPDPTFIKMLAQLRFNTVYLERFLYTFTKDQILLSLQLLTDISIQGLSTVQKELLEIVKKNAGQLDMVKKNAGQKASGLKDVKIENTFWKAAFNQIPTAKDYEGLKEECIRQTLLELGIDQKRSGKENQNKKRSSKENQNVYLIRSLVEKYRIQYPGNTVWQQFFQHVSKVVNSPSFYQIPPDLLKEFKQLLADLESAQKKSQQTIGADKKPTEEDIATMIETMLQPIAQYLQWLQTSTRQLQPNSEPLVIEQLQSPFEETDFITIQNAGLVLFWPFLQRFFENLEVIEGKTFHHETARNKAICALQYLCGEQDITLFEGALPLNKILCGAPLEDTVAPTPLSVAEKEMAEDLLHAVIQRGPHWTNLSTDGFRDSYLCRQGSLRTRDGHWLLQVQKETYDITLEKLPWSINTVKLPWMDEILIVEWN